MSSSPVLLLATTNPGKLREIRSLLAGAPVELRSLADVPPVPEPEESGRTFEENARAKALAYAAATGLDTVAEDSGLAIDALDGAPGVWSARAPGATYAEKFAWIYGELAMRPGRPRTARFVCALALVRDGRVVFETRGVVEGEIAPAPRGAGGFGYDPIFYHPPLGRTLGEVAAEEKARVSHRAQAFTRLREFLVGRGA